MDRISFVKSSVASLYATGRSSGYVWEVSETKNQFVCVEDGFIDQKLIFSHPVTLSNVMNTFLERDHLKFSQRPKVGEIKGDSHRVSVSLPHTRKSVRDFWVSGHGNSHFPFLTLPDGSDIENPNLAKNSAELLEIFMSKKFPHRQDVLCVGGVFGFSNFHDRIEEIINSKLNSIEIFLDPKGMTDLQFRRYAPFLGSSILGSLSGYSDFYLSRKDYFDLMHLTNPPVKESNDVLLEEDPKAKGTKRGKFSVVDRLFQ